eukprot:TRINITY_DN7394_c0_g1_i1.p1 TRINITY_DN7394_c0_g1~~TRINITY_DN7394_c0_g1_i1.p1  ORF type:complete len:640 (-),score=117.59 TRINITY_DN7394_c0_g1_i1:201-1988(-)
MSPVQATVPGYPPSSPVGVQYYGGGVQQSMVSAVAPMSPPAEIISINARQPTMYMTAPSEQQVYMSSTVEQPMTEPISQAITAFTAPAQEVRLQAASNVQTIQTRGLELPHHVTTIKHAGVSHAIEREVEVPRVEAVEQVEVMRQKLERKKVTKVETKPRYVKLVKEVLKSEYVDRVKEVQKPVYETNLRQVEVPHHVEREVMTEVPQVQVVDLKREQMRVENKYVPKHVEKPVVQVQERMVDVPCITTKEVVQEVPVVERVEIVKQVPGPVTKRELVKEVRKHEIQHLEVPEGLPVVERLEQPVEVPEIEYREVIRQVPKVEVQIVEKRVPKKEYRIVEKVVEVPHTVYEEHIVEVPEIEYCEVIKKVPKPYVQYVDKQVAVRENRVYERQVDEPVALPQEHAVEVPEMHVVELTTQVQRPQYENLEKQFEKVYIEAREVHQEVPVTVKHEHPVEVDQINVVEAIVEVSHPSTQIEEKTVTETRTVAVPRQVAKRQVFTIENPVVTTVDQPVECLHEEHDVTVKQVTKSIPKYNVAYKEKHVEVRAKYIDETSHHSSNSRVLKSSEIPLSGQGVQGRGLQAVSNADRFGGYLQN